tara:strand:- start:780 stop:995 length:216 start_codon:yes stop_codon:yes gene_type:complete
MIIKQQAVYDIRTDKFKYLKRKKNRISQRVDINELNERLNRTKRSSFYTTFLIAVFCLSSMIALVLISIKF